MTVGVLALGAGAADGFGDCLLRPLADCCEPDFPAVGTEGTIAGVELATAGGGATDLFGAVDVVGRVVWWCSCVGAVGEDTTTFGGGGVPEWDPVDGMCRVPESSSSAIAAAPSRIAISGAATRPPVIQSPRPLPRSSPDTVLPSPRFADPSPDLPQRYKKRGRTATGVRSRRSLFPAES